MEDVATSTAIALQADKLVFDRGLPACPRTRTTRKPIDTELAPGRRRAHARQQPAHAVARGGDVLPAALRPRLPGGRRAPHIIPFSVDGALLQEVYTHDGIGTMVVDESWKACARPRPTMSAASLP